MKDRHELRQRILTVADTLRAYGIIWRPFADRRAEVENRRGRIPNDVAASLRSLVKEAVAVAQGTPTDADFESVLRRFRELVDPLREPGEIWPCIDPERAHVLRGRRRLPSDVMAEMKSLLDELRAAFRAKTTEKEVASFARRCRELAEHSPEKEAAELEALAERSERERTAHWEEYELLCDYPEDPVWGSILFVEPGEQGGVELRTFFRDPEMAEVFHHRTEPTMDTCMSLWRLVAACESGFGGLTVCDVMHTGKAVPRVETSTSIRDTIYEMSRGKLGIAAVTDAEGRLVGCLSDGDLRRLLEYDDSPLDRTAGDCMKAGPHTVDGTALAASALQLMETHRVTSLFICDAEGRLEGIVHQHDLWRQVF